MYTSHFATKIEVLSHFSNCNLEGPLKVVGQVCVPDYPLNQPQAEIQIGECGTHWAICKVLCRLRAMELYPVHVWGYLHRIRRGISGGMNMWQILGMPNINCWGSIIYVNLWAPTGMSSNQPSKLKGPLALLHWKATWTFALYTQPKSKMWKTI